MSRALLLISNSTMPGEEYLGWPKQFISNFLTKYQVKRLTFIPYAGVGLSTENLKVSYDVYLSKVSAVFSEMGVRVESVHQTNDPVEMIKNAESVAVGGGNTFHLVAKMQEYGVMNAIRQKALDGMPYMGWSAGANVACPTMMTTNDMPIIQPMSFHCLGIVPFQINPHYLDANPAGHGGETRQQRIEEYLIVNRQMRVVGLREASLLEVEGNKMKLTGYRPLREFSFGKDPVEHEPGSDLSHLL